MNAPRTILTPGEVPAEPAADVAAQAVEAKPRGKPGPKPKASPAPADDLSDFESEDLPPAPAAAAGVEFTPEQMAAIQKMIGAAVQASKASQDPQTAAKLAAEKLAAERLPTQAEAKAVCDDAVAQGIRPRPILTTDGWYAHPEMARTRDVGVSMLGG